MSLFRKKNTGSFAPKTFVVCHLTTAHDASDVRIFERECKSIANKSEYQVVLVAHGQMPLDLNIRHIPLGEIPKNRLPRLIKSQYVAARYFFKLKVDVWHLHDPELLLFGCALILLKKKVIWDAHEDYFLQFRNPQEHRTYIPKSLRNPTKNIVISLLAFVGNRANAVVSATYSISQSYENANMAIVGNEARVEEFASCAPRFTNNRVLFTGATNEAQCFRQVVDAISTLDDLVLTVAGKEPIINERIYAEKMLGKRFVYLGWLNRLELSEAISNSKIGLITHNNQNTNETNSPNKRFEFSAGGLPCVATPTTSNINWVCASSGAILADGFSSEQLAQALNKLNKDQSKWEQISHSTRIWCQEFGSWEKSEKILMDTYERALD
jgi:glycosyltransferase involved in cell wall biosynthesis